MSPQRINITLKKVVRVKGRDKKTHKTKITNNNDKSFPIRLKRTENDIPFK